MSCVTEPVVLLDKYNMADAFDDEQRELSQLWKKARKDGCMSPWQQAKAYGLSEAWEEMHGERVYGKATWIAERVYVQGRECQHPTAEAIRNALHMSCKYTCLPSLAENERTNNTWRGFVTMR